MGGGPGGYVAAIKAAQKGLKVACVEKRGALGGTCLNVGCIPSKALLQSSHHYEMAAHGLAVHGVQVGKPVLDLAAMMKRKQSVVSGLTKGIEFLFKKNKVDYVVGAATLQDAGTVTVGDKTLKGRNIAIATGSDVAPLQGVAIDERRIVSSTGALALETVPGHLVVVGAGVIGLELGSVWRRLGAEVTVVEFMDTILPGMDLDVRKTMQRSLEKQGLKFRLSHKVASAKAGKDGVTLSVEPRDGGGAEALKADVVLVAIGRRPYTEGLGLDKLGVEMDPRGFVKVDRQFRTNVPGIHAIGDVIGGPMLAHKAEDEGVALAEILAGGKAHVDYNTIPGVVYTHPEAASVGRSEDALKRDGVAYKAGKYPFSANSRALANGDAEGFVKVLADARTDRLLGVHIVGPNAGDLIQEAVSVMEFGGAAEDIALTCHAHPGLAEAVREAAMMAASGKAIHM
ncbi:MAG: dihydrolipoyl dehydrogenase [Magnetospirillum sp. WYHS-4]